MKAIKKLETVLQRLFEPMNPSVEPLEVATEIKKGFELHKRHDVGDQVLVPNQITLLFSATDAAMRTAYDAWFSRDEFLQYLINYVEKERGYVLLAPMKLSLVYATPDEKRSKLKPFRIAFAWGDSPATSGDQK